VEISGEKQKERGGGETGVDGETEGERGGKERRG